jgi:hypothetical protein
MWGIRRHSQVASSRDFDSGSPWHERRSHSVTVIPPAKISTQIRLVVGVDLRDYGNSSLEDIPEGIL